MLYRNFFAGQRRGLYLDVGTNAPIAISNTVFFDACLGWEGICFEPQSRYHATIRKERTCSLVPRCVLGRAANVTMSGSDVLARFDPSARRLANRREPGTRRKAAGGGPGSMSCVGVLEELARLRLRGRTVDLLSIDIEGSEPAVLRCLPWGEVDIRTVLIETDKADLRHVDAFFASHGYANVASIMRYNRPQRTGTYLDHVYAKLPGGGLATPASGTHCSHEDKLQNKWCSGWIQYDGAAPAAGWGACDAR